jgi:YD repeat-containing protein
VAAFGAPGSDFVRIWYDGFGQPVTILSHMFGRARYLNHHYDKDGNREHLTFTEDGARIRYHYDGLGRMSAVHDRPEHSGPDDLVVRYWHRPEGPRHLALFGSGGPAAGYYYDSVQRLAAIATIPTARHPVDRDYPFWIKYLPARRLTGIGGPP